MKTPFTTIRAIHPDQWAALRFVIIAAALLYADHRLNVFPWADHTRNACYSIAQVILGGTAGWMLDFVMFQDKANESSQRDPMERNRRAAVAVGGMLAMIIIMIVNARF